MAIECFKIEWTKLFPLSEIGNQPEVNESGVYARFALTGSGKKIHYIGKSTDFRRRSGEHRRATAILGPDSKKYYITLGVVYSFERTRMSLGCTSKQLNDIESYLRNEVHPIGNDSSTLKGYSGSPIIIANTGVVPRGIKKIMSHNPELLKVLGIRTTARKAASDSWWY